MQIEIFYYLIYFPSLKTNCIMTFQRTHVSEIHFIKSFRKVNISFGLQNNFVFQIKFYKKRKDTFFKFSCKLNDYHCCIYLLSLSGGQLYSWRCLERTPRLWSVFLSDPPVPDLVVFWKKKKNSYLKVVTQKV